MSELGSARCCWAWNSGWAPTWSLTAQPRRAIAPPGGGASSLLARRPASAVALRLTRRPGGSARLSRRLCFAPPDGLASFSAAAVCLASPGCGASPIPPNALPEAALPQATPWILAPPGSGTRPRPRHSTRSAAARPPVRRRRRLTSPAGCSLCGGAHSSPKPSAASRLSWQLLTALAGQSKIPMRASQGAAGGRGEATLACKTKTPPLGWVKQPR